MTPRLPRVYGTNENINNMKILIVTESYWPNRDGGSVFERALALGLADRGHEVRVVAPSPTGPAYVEQDGASQIHRTRSIRLPGKFGKIGARSSLRPKPLLARLLAEWTPDVIHTHNPFAIGRAALDLAEKHSIPFVATNHNMPENTVDNIGWLGKLVPNLAERIWRWQIKFLNRAQFVTTPTQPAVDLLLANGLKAPVKAISNGVDLSRFNPRTSPAAVIKKLNLPQKPTVLYMGRLDGEKRMDVWLKAAPLVRKEVDAHFLIGGRGAELNRLRRLAVDLGVSRHTTFAGLVEDDDLPGFYRAGSVFAIASPAELQSIVTLEAMGAGLPVVACDAGALPELCKSGRNGFLFLAGDPTGLAKSLVRILQNPTMGEKMGAESRRIVEKDHDVRAMPARYEAVYQHAIESPR